MPIYAPFGVFDGEVIDPAVLAREFQEASKCAASTDQWNWERDTFDREDLEEGHLVALGICETECILDFEDQVRRQQFTDLGLWEIPYNRGFVPVGTGNAATGVCEVTWAQKYPSLVMATFAFQYVREYLGYYGGDLQTDDYANFRVQVRLAINGSRVPGTGPYAMNLMGEYRGLGYADMFLGSTVTAIMLLPAGNHVIRPEAAQISVAVSQPGSSEDAAPDTTWTATPSSRVTIASRHLSVLRFGRGTTLSG